MRGCGAGLTYQMKGEKIILHKKNKLLEVIVILIRQ